MDSSIFNNVLLIDFEQKKDNVSQRGNMRNRFTILFFFSILISILTGCSYETKIFLIPTYTPEHESTKSISNTLSITPTSTTTISLTASFTPTATITATPTIAATPTPIGNGYPLLAYLIYNNDNTEEKYLRILDLQQQKTITEIPLPSAAYKITFSDDGRILAYGIYEKNEVNGRYIIQLFHLDTGEIETGPTIYENKELEALSISPNSDWLMYQFFDHANRHPEIYVYHIPSKRITFVDNGICRGNWTKDNVLIYQQYYSSNMKFNPETQQRQIIKISPQTKLFPNMFSETSYRYLQEVDGILLTGTSREDNSSYYIIVSLSTDEEYFLAHVSPDEKKYVNRVFISPNREYFFIESCYIESASTRKVCETFFVREEDLPLTNFANPLNIFPIGWSPDSKSFLAYQPRDGGNAEAVIFDSESLGELMGYTLVDGRLKNHGFYALVAEYFGVDYYWADGSPSFNVVPYTPSEVDLTQTLSPNNTPSP